jgi:hypothetical protein
VGCAGLKLGYYSPMANDFLFCYSISAGEAFLLYQSVPIPNLHRAEIQQQSTFLAPTFMITYRVNDQLRIGIDLSADFLPYVFNPYTVGFNNYINYSGYNTSNLTAIICWGFSAFYAFGQK